MEDKDVRYLERLINTSLDAIRDDIAEIKEAIRKIHENEFPHIWQEIEALKKWQWKMAGAIGALWAATQIVLHFWK